MLHSLLYSKNYKNIKCIFLFRSAYIGGKYFDLGLLEKIEIIFPTSIINNIRTKGSILRNIIKGIVFYWLKDAIKVKLFLI